MTKDLIIYHANRIEGNSEYQRGKEICISTDTTVQSTSVAAISPRYTFNNTGNSAVSLFPVSTAPTSVKGMFRSYISGQNVGINNRELIWLRFGDSNLFFATSDTPVSTTVTSYQNDFTISQTFTEEMFVICMYNVSNVDGGTFTGGTTYDRFRANLRTYISTLASQRDPDGTTSTMASSNMATHGMGLRVVTIPAGDTTFTAQYCSLYGGNTVTLGRRQFVIIAIPKSKIDDGTVERYYIEYDTTQVSTTSTTFINDNRATLSFTPSTTRKALIIYNVMSSNNGLYHVETAIDVDGITYDVSRACQFIYGSNNYPKGSNVSILFLDSLSPTTHTVQGKFRVDSATGYIFLRQMVVLLW
jgi:hypothetical protein